MSHTGSTRKRRGCVAVRVMLLAGVLLPALAPAGPSPAVPEGLLLVVGDPLARENACPCIKGYAQRDYRLVADLITRETGRPVELLFF